MIDGRTERTGSRSLACWLVTLVATGALAAGCGDESSPAPIVDAGSDARGGAGGAGGGGGTPGAGGADAAQGGAGGAMDAPVDNPPVDAPGEVQPTDGGSDTDEIDTAPPSNPAPEDLDGLQWTPTFEPDYNRLTPQPWVELASTTQTQEVIVLPDRLIFPAATNQEVLQWEPGRVVVSPPGNGIGSNAMGYARKVRTVATVGNAIEVMTETPSLSEIITGDVQHTFDYGQMQDMDLSKMDLQWAADNLYTDAPMLSPEMDADHIQYDDPLPDVDENFEPLPGDPLFGNIFKAVAKGVSAVGNAIGGAAKAVANTAVNVYRAVTPASFGGSVSISSALDIKYKSDLFVISYRKNFNAMGRRPIQLHISGNGNIDSSIYFRPGTQMGMRIPNLGHNTTFATWLNVDSQFRAYLKVGLDLTTALESAGGMSGKALEDAVNAGAEFAEDVLAQVKQKATGDPDMKPAGGWKRTVFITKPAMQTVFAGPIPVIFTQTFQVDVECGFSLQAQLKANLEYERVSNLKFNAHYESSRVTGTTPIFENRKSTSVQVTGGGSAAVSCGIIPRLNVFVYDTAGLNAGVRGSLVAKAAMESTCVPNPTVSKPKGEVSVGLYGNIGVQVGGRLQAPGSSWAGKSGTSAGFDIGPFEPWNTEFPLYEKKWTLAQGLGYCTPLCRDGVRNAMETDRDCGGGACGACANGQLCARTTDCARGFCAAGRCSLDDHCGDGIRNGDETGIDCGGAKCKKCRNAVACFLPRDCMSGFCAVKPGTGSRSGNCVANHCTDFTVTGNESGIDCGGATCAKCALGVATTVAADCASGFGNGRFCVANACLNQLKEANESDVDCGGTSACGRCSKGQACTGNSDCAAAAPTCDVVTKRCVSASCTNGARDGSETDVDCGGTCPGKCTADKICSVAGDCGAGLDCGPTKTCVAPTCTDARKNGSESDVDCGGSCPGGCPRDKACNTKEDCASVLDCNPTSKLCVIPLCTDGRKNRDETDVDCGASCPNRCVADQICAVTGDCAVGLECSPEKRCTGSTCTDGRKGGAESDVDCGSVCPTRCAAGKICGITGDCAAGLECGPGATCVAPTCTDGRANGVETGVDCGGTCPNGCPAALSCTVDADCVAGLECSPAKLCVVPTCVDARKNRDETDVDCGGSCLARCGFSQACAGTGDCVAGLECSPGNICVAPTCSDARRNRDETDVDCGGTACTARCATNQGCFFTADCAMGLECGPAGKCVAPTCFDSRKNQNETDVDCGGLCMLRCAATQMCGTSVDCAAGLECGPGNLCVAPTCSDARKNQNETDVDCGGACTGCAATQACLVNGDCAMGLECGPGNLCVAPTCSDARKNQNESDVDCGGVCTGCALTKVCNGDVDCAAGLDCDNTNHCVVGCAAGRWIDNGVCTDAGVGFWAPGGGTIRTACVNKPANSSYTSATASSANCPWVCDAGFLRSGGMCVVSANARELRCNPDEVGIGIYGRAGAWLDAMGIRCATLTGTTLGAPRAVASVGGNGGDPFTYDCQAGEALVKVTGKNGFSTAGPNAGWCSTTNLSTITIHCKNLTTGVVSQRNTAGGAQGACQVPLSTFDFNCETIVGAGSLMNGFIVDAANTMTYVGFVLDTACR